MNKPLTAEDYIPATIKWARATTFIGKLGEGYRIVSEESAYGSYMIYSLYLGSVRLDRYSSQKEAKTGAEMHKLGLGTFVRFFNIPGKG